MHNRSTFFLRQALDSAANGDCFAAHAWQDGTCRRCGAREMHGLEVHRRRVRPRLGATRAPLLLGPAS